jgi:hypothetical protein
MANEVSPLVLRPRMAGRNQNIILVLAGAVMVAIAAAVIYALMGVGGASKTQSLIANEVRGQLVTKDVSCHRLDFAVPSLTKQQIYYCNAKGVTLYNRPNGHIHDSAFTRCYVMAVNGQTVDISHALSIEAKIRHKTVPCR